MDPITYYLNTMKTVVHWPPLDVPAHLTIPPNLDVEPMWTRSEWLERGLASHYPTSSFTPLLSKENIDTLWKETEAQYPLLPMNSQAIRFLSHVAEFGYSSRLSTITATHHKNHMLEPRLWTPAIIVMDQWLRAGFLHGPYDSPPFQPAKINGLLGKFTLMLCHH